MYKIKPTNSHELCSLTNPKSNGVVKMDQKDQPFCSELMLEALEDSIDRLDSIQKSFICAAKINSPINEIINDENDTFFPGRDIFDVMDKLDDIISSKISRIKELPEIHRLTRDELSNTYDEYSEPENQSSFGAGTPSLSELMGDI